MSRSDLPREVPVPARGRRRVRSLTLTAAASLCLAVLVAAAVPSGVAGAAPSGAPRQAPPAVARAVAPVVPAWRPVGPSQQGGRIARSPADPRAGVLRQPDGAVLWHTLDGGRSWRQVLGLPTVTRPRSTGVVVDPADASHWWYAAPPADGGPGTVVSETRDAGDSWVPVARTTGEVVSFERDTTSDVVVLATRGADSTTVDDVHVGVDGGSRWTSTAAPAGTTGVTVAGGALLVVGPGGVSRRTLAADGGLGPEQVVLPVDPAQAQRVGQVSADGDLVAAVVLGRGLVGSTDGGRTWRTWLDGGQPGNGVIASVDVSAGDVLVRSSFGRTRTSRDGGATFEDFPLPESRSAHQQLQRWPDGSLTVSSPSSGVWRSASGLGDDYERTGAAGASVPGLVAVPDRLLAATSLGWATTSLPVGGDDWADPAATGLGSSVSTVARVGDAFWRTTQDRRGGHRTERSTDGVRWTAVHDGDGLVTALAGAADGSLVVAAVQSGSACSLELSRDGGRTWESRPDRCLDDLVVVDGTTWAAGPQGVVRSGADLTTWTAVADGPSRSLLVDRGRVLVGGHGVRVLDAASSSPVGPAVTVPELAPTARVTSLLRVGPRLVAGLADDDLAGGPAVLVSDDDGATWYDATGDLVDAEVLSLAASPDRRTLWVGTDLGGVHELVLPAPVLPTAGDDAVSVPHGGTTRADVLADDSGGDAPFDPSTVGLVRPDGATGPAGSPARELDVEGLRLGVGDDGSVTVTDVSGAGPRTTTVDYEARTLVGDGVRARLVVTVLADGEGADGEGADGDAAAGGQRPGTGGDPSGGAPVPSHPSRAARRLAATGGLGSLAGVLGLGALLALAGGAGLVVERRLRRHDDRR